MGAMLLAGGAHPDYKSMIGPRCMRVRERGPVDVLWNVVRLLLRKSAKAESSVPLNRKWMCGGLSEPHSANLLYLAMGLRLPRSEYSPEPPPEERRKVPMAMLLVYGARKEVEMKIIGEYLKLWPRLQMEVSRIF
jgi:hypothetical protein